MGNGEPGSAESGRIHHEGIGEGIGARVKVLNVAVVVWLGMAPAAGAEPPAPAEPVAPAAPERQEPDHGPASKERTLKQFPIELVRNFGALFAKDNAVPLLIGGLATGVATVPKDRLEGYFRDKEPSPFRHPGDLVGAKWVTVPAMAGFLLISRTTENTRFRSYAYSLSQSYVLSQALVTGVKRAVQSERPNGQNKASFPSGHTAGAFAWAAVTSHHYGKKLGIPAYMAAVYMGYARMDDRAHRLTDVVAGATIGYIIGRTVSRRSGFEQNRRVAWGVTVPAGGGAAVTMNFNLDRRL